ncbi:MAG: tail fiber domain-containing protein [Saprospiraceae bacterium]|nr:tail fiber domain-containing protein [Saprospiraceae bacterium]
MGTKGYIGSGNGSPRNEFWEYNSTTNVWTQKANVGGNDRSASCSCSLGTKGYIIAGSEQSYLPLLNDNWVYNSENEPGKEYVENIPSDAVIYKGHDWTSSRINLYTTVQNVQTTVRGDLAVDGTVNMKNSLSTGLSSASFNSGEASGTNSTALNDAHAIGLSSTAINNGQSIGENSITMNEGQSMGQNCSAMNLGVANGINSTAMNRGASNGAYSATTGYLSYSNGYSSFVCGIYNDSLLTRQTSISATTPLFIVGNGDGSFTRSNALVVRKDGLVTVKEDLVTGSSLAVGSTALPVNKLQVTGGTSLVLNDASTGHLTLGYTSSTNANLVMDPNDIQAKSGSSTAADLNIQRLGGDLHVGPGTSGSQKLNVYGSAYKNDGSTAWVNTSDKRLKEDISDYHDGLLEVLKIHPVWYKYKKESECDTTQKHIGVIAQEIQKVAPYMISNSTKLAPDGTPYLQLDNSAMTYMLINAVKELAVQNEALRIQNEAFKTTLAGMLSDIKNIKQLHSNQTLTKNSN